MKKKPQTAAWMLALGLFLSPVASPLFAGTTTEALTETLHIQDPFVRAVPPGAPATAAFMGLYNSGEETLVLVGAASPSAEVVELHTHTSVDGVMQMRRIEEIQVPAGGSTQLKPGGLHLMLIGLKEPLHPDASVAITLEWHDGRQLDLSVPVRRLQLMDGDGRMHRKMEGYKGQEGKEEEKEGKREERGCD